mmetsp:Transcript_87274/g.182679  ORF Transcript_87274/g.182679 Transcript_87274/m.182679 type:complete len:88 (+) Transcript_87274:267-530(+)
MCEDGAGNSRGAATSTFDSMTHRRPEVQVYRNHPPQPDSPSLPSAGLGAEAVAASAGFGSSLAGCAAAGLLLVAASGALKTATVLAM